MSRRAFLAGFLGCLTLGLAPGARAQALPDLTGTWLGRVVCTEQRGGTTTRLVRESTLQIFHETPGLPDLEVRLDDSGYLGFVVDPAETRSRGVGGLVACGSNDDYHSYAEVHRFEWRLSEGSSGVTGVLRGRSLRSYGGFPVQECRGRWKRLERAAPLVNSCT
jgi:hypothetical protein